MEPGVSSQRGIVEVAGPDARTLLQRLVTNDVEQLLPGEARYAALLTPQGKILVDFFIVSCPNDEEPERFLLDCPGPLAADLAKRLTLYRLRAKLTVADRSGELDATPLLEEIAPTDRGLVVFLDPRNAALGFRAIGPTDVIAILRGPAADVEVRRIEAGVPEGGVDFVYGDTFPHEANLDRLNGVDFRKGCYVGQEVVSRMEHRGTARKRIVSVSFDGTAPRRAAEIQAGGLPIGTMGSSAGQRGLALVRTDRVEQAADPLTVEGRMVRVHT